MDMTEEKIRENFSHNLACYRRDLGLTQLELAEKLNYSDKSVSKWERGEGLPDLYIIKCIADLFGVTVDDMIGEKKIKRPILHRNKIIITALSVGIVWFVATVLFFVFSISIPSFPSWHFYIYALPISSIVATVFACLWWNKFFKFLSVSAIIWSVVSCIYIIITYFTHGVQSLNLIFAVAGVFEILTLFWFLMKRAK